MKIPVNFLSSSEIGAGRVKTVEVNPNFNLCILRSFLQNINMVLI